MRSSFLRKAYSASPLLGKRERRHENTSITFAIFEVFAVRFLSHTYVAMYIFSLTGGSALCAGPRLPFQDAKLSVRWEPSWP